MSDEVRVILMYIIGAAFAAALAALVVFVRMIAEAVLAAMKKGKPYG